MIEAIGTVRKAAVGYRQQQFYADRAQSLSVIKTTQIGLTDKVTLSPEARISVEQTAVAATTGPPTKSSAKGGIVAYEDPRKTVPYEDRQKSGSKADPYGPPAPAPAKEDTNELNKGFVEGLPVIDG